MSEVTQAFCAGVAVGVLAVALVIAAASERLQVNAGGRTVGWDLRSPEDRLADRKRAIADGAEEARRQLEPGPKPPGPPKPKGRDE